MVDHIGNVGGVNSPANARKLKQVYRMGETPAAQDAVEISGDVMKLRGVEGIRLDKVLEVKRAVASGTYLTPEKLDQALNKALDDARE